MTQPVGDTVLAYVEAAYAAYRRRVDEPGYLPPTLRTPEPPPRIRRDFDDPDKLHPERAFSWLDIADAYTRDRLGQPALDAQGVRRLYEADYRANWVRRKEPFPAARLAKYGLSLLQLHDVFGRVKQYAGPREAWSDEDAEHPDLEPFGMMMVMAKKMAQNGKIQYWRRNKAVTYLNKLGVYVGHLTIEQRRPIRDQYLDAHRYPRTYL